jgi:hypothetical protein
MKTSIWAFVAALVLAIGVAGSSQFALASVDGQVGYDADGNEGHIHTVVSGDTLWDISSSYLNTPWVWPSIWNENPEVANPHRIFPGDKIWISSNQMRRITDEEAEALLNGEPTLVVEEEVAEEVVMEEEIPAARGEIPVESEPLFIMSYRERDKRGVIGETSFANTPTIVESGEAGTLLYQGSEVYIDLGEGEVSKGDVFNIVREEGAIRDPGTKRRLGYYVESLGWLKVIKVGPDTSTAKIMESRREIERGARLVPRVEDAKEIAINFGSSSATGKVAHIPDERGISGGFDVVFLNRGANTGVEVGNLIEVTRYGGKEWGEALEKRKSLKLPTEVVAHLVILSAEDNTSMAYIAHATDVIKRGDDFRMAHPE